MKKRLLPLAALALASMSAFAQYAPSAQTDVYDLSKFSDNILDLFYEVLQDGRKYPTMAELEAFGVDPIEVNFVRSHVRPRSIMLDHSKDINQNVAAGRPLWMNVPLGIGKEQGGYPNTNPGDDTFTGWNYTRIFGSWNNGLFHAPAVVTDAGHKHGTDVYSGIKFFDTTGNPGGVGADDWMNVLSTKDANGYAGYKYVEPLINCLMFFGQDGINYNWEDSGFTNTDVVAFHQACYKLAKERGFDNFHIGIYTSASQLTAGNVIGLYGKGGVKTADAFLNYSGGDFAGTAAQSVNTALQQNLEDKDAPSLDGVYQGAWIVTMSRGWSKLVANETAKKIGIVLWGEHGESRLHSYNQGNDATEYADNYQKLQERFFSGGYRNPATRPAATNGADWMNANPEYDGLRTFQGLAEYVPERTALQQNLPFTTHFNTGSGDRYNYKGKKTAGAWYNLGTQDYQPTYRWLVFDKGTTTAVTEGLPEYTISDAYTGGTCLRLTNTQPVDIQLYRCALTCSAGNPKATVALKRFAGAPEGTVSVIVKKQGSDEWLETEFANVQGNTWEEQTVELQGIAQGDVIEYIGLRTNGNTNGLLVGKLSLNDDVKVEPAKVRDLVVDVKEETQISLSVKLAWDVDKAAIDRADYNLLYNDEAGIDHFEVLYKNGENGDVTEVSRTTTWSGYVGNIPMAEGENPYIGVRAASVDGKSYSPVVWVNVPRANASELPADNPAVGSYPPIVINPSAEGYENALKTRWFKKVLYGVGKLTTADLASMEVIHTADAAPADKTNYALVEKHMKAKQGDDVTIVWTDGGTSDGLQYCTGRGYADWDGDFNFNAGNDELIWYCGDSNAKKQNSEYHTPYELTFHIPEDAVPGESRVRLVFSDAWFPHPGASGVTAKGFAIDFPIDIEGENPARQAAEDTHDQGLADAPEALGAPVVGIHGVSGAISQAALNGRELRLENVEKVWIYNAEGKLMKFAKDAENVDMQTYAPGTYLVRMQNGQVIRNAKFIVK